MIPRKPSIWHADLAEPIAVAAALAGLLVALGVVLILATVGHW